MGSVVVCGGGPVGLSVAMMLAADGHQVTVLEADPAPVPDPPAAAWDSWARAGVAQFRQPHNLLPRFRHVCDEELPGLTERLVAAGCPRIDPLPAGRLDGFVPPTLPDRGSWPGDTAFRHVTGRRPVVESVIAAAAGEQPGLDVRRGVRVAALTTGPAAIPGVPHVTGVRTADGAELAADLVVDAMGRRSRSDGLLAAAGVQVPPPEAADSGFTYYTRFFTGPSRPRTVGPPLADYGSVCVLTIDGDNDTWSVTAYFAGRDAPLRALRDTGAFARVIGACPLQAHWLDGTPITGVVAMSGVLDRIRHFTAAGQPVVTGFAPVGDAWACTNPSAGRGLTVGLIHAQVLRRMARGHLGDPAAFARAFARATQEQVAPFVRDQLQADRARLAAMTAIREGRPWSPPDIPLLRLAALASADAGVFRGMLECVTCLALPDEVIQRPAIRSALESVTPIPRALPGPDRPALLSLLSA